MVRPDDVESAAMTAPPTGPRSIAVLTTGRQDWGILRIDVRGASAASRTFGSMLVVGRHAPVGPARPHGRPDPRGRLRARRRAAAGSTARRRRRPGRRPGGGGAASGRATACGQTRSDALLLVGDRFETAAAALAATLERVPIVHLHGGEQTLGAFDDALRHAITKLSHLHLVSTRGARAAGSIAMGEDPATVHVVGAPGLDARGPAGPAGPRRAGGRAWASRSTPPVVIVTVHPATLDADPAAAARPSSRRWTPSRRRTSSPLPNVDPGADAVARPLLAAAATDPAASPSTALGERRYWGLLRRRGRDARQQLQRR